MEGRVPSCYHTSHSYPTRYVPDMGSPVILSLDICALGLSVGM